MSTQANQPAFLTYHQTGTGLGHPGLTKRQHFAAMAMNGFLSADFKMQQCLLDMKIEAGVKTFEVAIAQLAVSVADALLKALEDGNNDG